MLGLYVHIPFCEHICTYCDFVKRIKKDDKMIPNYLEALKRDYEKIKDLKFDTIYIGGGTPSMLNLHELETLLEIFNDQIQLNTQLRLILNHINIKKDYYLNNTMLIELA